MLQVCRWKNNIDTMVSDPREAIPAASLSVCMQLLQFDPGNRTEGCGGSYTGKVRIKNFFTLDSVPFNEDI